MDQHLVPVRNEIAVMASDLYTVIGVPFERTSELQRQILATFAFGMIFAVGQLRRLSPPEVHVLAIACLMDVFKYADHQAAAFSADLIVHASSKNPKDTHKAIIHRGIDGHRQWQQKQNDQLKINIEGIFEALKV
ncbi:MAG: Imm48 family immunity protein [Phycisphaerae bacterium]